MKKFETNEIVIEPNVGIIAPISVLAAGVGCLALSHGLFDEYGKSFGADVPVWRYVLALVAFVFAIGNSYFFFRNNSRRDWACVVISENGIQFFSEMIQWNDIQSIKRRMAGPLPIALEIKLKNGEKRWLSYQMYRAGAWIGLEKQFLPSAGR